MPCQDDYELQSRTFRGGSDGHRSCRYLRSINLDAAKTHRNQQQGKKRPHCRGFSRNRRFIKHLDMSMPVFYRTKAVRRVREW